MASDVPMAETASPSESRKRPREDDDDLPLLPVRTYIPERVLGRGSFGSVYQARCKETGEIVAIKSVSAIHLDKPLAFKVPEDGTYKPDREAQILKEMRGHPNIVKVFNGFLSVVPENGSEAGQQRMNLVMEFLSDTLHRVLKHYNKLSTHIDLPIIKLYQYQILRGLAFAHGKGIVHCDIKPQNLLLDGATQTLKICDWGTAKKLYYLGQEGLNSYCCSRYYRAPECILGSREYGTPIDVWAAGCVFAEMFIRQPLFAGRHGQDQLIQIMDVMGTPTSQDLQAMNAALPPYEMNPKTEAVPWDKVLRGHAGRDAVLFMDKMLRYDPRMRSMALMLLQERFFDTLRRDENPARRFLFEFLEGELGWLPREDAAKLVPRWVQTPQGMSPPARGPAASSAAGAPGATRPMTGAAGERRPGS